jgi:hypothetical protein
MIRASDVASIVATTILGAVTGWLIGGTPAMILTAAVFGGLAVLGARANIRPAIVSVVLAATMAGGLIGSGIVEAICLPSSCSTLEATGGVVTAILTFVGVGLVAALVTRSFDEYNEREAAGLPPTGIGCETDDERPTTDD